MSNDTDLMGVAEVAAAAGVRVSAISNWRKRYKNFPKPRVQLAMGPIYRGKEIRAWLKKRQSLLKKRSVVKAARKQL